MSYDAHNYKRRLENHIRLLTNSTRITPQNKTDIMQFKDECFAQGLSLGRVVRYMSDLRMLAVWLGKDFRCASESDLKSLVRKIQEMPYAASYKRDFKITLRKLYRFLRHTTEDPEELKWMKVENRTDKRKLPEDMLSEEDIKSMINMADNPRDKALVAVMYESGCRIGEILSLRIKQVKFDTLGGYLMVNGKTGARRVRIVSSVPFLTTWINEHPLKEIPDASFWIRRRGNELEMISYAAVSQVLRRLQRKAKITKPVHPHNFRHSRATYLANHLTESQMKEYLGWVQASKMAAVYVHLSGRDIDNAILKTYGIQTENNGKQESLLKPQACQRCSETNPATNKYCFKCGFPLDEKERLQLLETNLQRSEADRIMDELIKDEEFKRFLEEKITKLKLRKV